MSDSRSRSSLTASGADGRSLWWMSLLPGLVAVLILWSRFPNREPVYLEELSHYLPAVERVRHGQLPTRDFVLMFSPGLPDLLNGWLRLFGDSVASTHYFFLAGWALLLLLLGVLVRSGGMSTLTASLCLAGFAVWSMPVVQTMNSWGGPRYLPGIAVLLLLQAWLPSAERRSRRRWPFIVGLSVMLGAVFAVEQVVLAVSAGVGVIALIPGIRRTVLHRSGLLAGLGGLALGVVLLIAANRAGILWAYLADLPRFAVWRQPLPANVGVAFAALLLVPALAYAVRWMDRRHQPDWGASAPEHRVLLFGLFALAQFVYAGRAFRNVQGGFGSGLLLLWVCMVLQQQWARSHRRILLVLLALLVPVLAHSMFPEAPGLRAAQWRRNRTGRSLWCEDRCVESRQPRLAGSQFPVAVRDELDSVVTLVRMDWRQSGDSTFLSFPEHGVFEYLLGVPSPTRFPITALAATTPVWRAALMDTLEAHPPRMVIRLRRVGNFAISTGRTEEVLPEVQSFLERRYRVVAHFRSSDVLRIRDSTTGW